MSVTSATENINFEKSENLLARVKRELRSFNQMGIVDPNDFYEYTMDVLENLGMGVMIEKQAVLEVKNSKVVLPEGFKYLYSATKCKESFKNKSGVSNNIHPQNGYVFYTDTLCERQITSRCKCACDNYKITVREYIEGVEEINTFNFTDKLYLVRSKLDNDGNKKPHQIELSGSHIHTGFEEGSIHIKYYSTPIDHDTGLPLIPDLQKVQRAIEYYVISKMFLSWYLNDEVPNIVQKAGEMDRRYREAFQEAMNERKTPGFATLVDYTRRQRQKFDAYRSLESYRNY